jgi:hypothetical protein
MTERDLAAIEARANGATAGPWEYDGGGGGLHKQRVLATRAPDGVVMDNEPYYPQMVAPADQEFCAAARTDVPALVAEVRRLRGALQNVCVHTGHNPSASKELLAELLASCQRIALAALWDV